MLPTGLPTCSATLVLAFALIAPSSAAAKAPQRPAQPAPAGKAEEKSESLVVNGRRSDVIATPDRVSFSVANDLQVQTGSIADALRAVPGVEVDLEGRLSLRGDPGVRILIDGRPSQMLNGDSRGDALLAMPAGRIERVEVMTNPSAALSPEGSAGVINLVTRRAPKDSRSASLRATLGPEGRGGLNLSGARSAGGLTVTGELGYRRMNGEANAVQLRSRRDPGTGERVGSRLRSDIDTANSARTGRIGIEYDPDKKNRISSELSYRRMAGETERHESFVSDNAAAGYDRMSETAILQRAIGGSVSWRHNLPGTDHVFTAEIEIEKGRLQRALDAVASFGSGQSAFEQIRNIGRRGEYRLKLDYKRPLGKGASLNLGYEGVAGENEFDFSGARAQAFDLLLAIPGLTNRFEYDQFVHAFYGTYRFNLGKLDAQTGLRLEQVETRINQVTDAFEVERDYFRAYPTLNLGYTLSNKDQLRGSYGRRIQRPSPPDLNPYTFYVDPQNLRRGNPALRPELTDSLELGWQHRDGPSFYSMTGFYRRSRGGVTDILTDLGGGVFLTSRANLAAARRVGVEAIANGRIGKTLTYNASATFLWNEIDLRQAGAAAPRSGTTGTVRANLSWQPTPKDFVQVNANYAGKQLLPQGYRRSGPVLNLGYRRKVDERLSLLVTAQNVLDSARQVTLFESAALRDRARQTGTGRILLFGLSLNLGSTSGRRKPEPGFDFQQGTIETQ